jgi:hypothetical protein
MIARDVKAIRIHLHGTAERSVIVWLNDTSKLCIQLMNPRRTWATTQAGDSLWLSKDGNKTRQSVDSVELYRVFPTTENGQQVRSAWHWLNPGKE